jgi:[acyl-carrier-protein] S-malonyltransferase
MPEQNIACIFPGQGAQYPGMGKEFYDSFKTAKLCFEEANDILGRNLSSLIFEGTADDLRATDNSQVAIYVTSIAIWRVLQEEIGVVAKACAGHSLGEYSALTATGKASFKDVLPIVAKRGELMSQACEKCPGKMAAVIGLSPEKIEEITKDNNELWAANFNCPGQVVISGTEEGIAKGIEDAKALGARRALPLQVHGAFHSGLMQTAEDELKPYLDSLEIQETPIQFLMNVSGDYEDSANGIRQKLIKQVTSPVLWEKQVQTMTESGINAFVEVGCGKVLTGLGKRIGVTGWNIEKPEDLEVFEMTSV